MDRASGHGGEGPAEAEGEDQDESSSRLRSGTSNALEEFRNEWRRELEKSPKHLNNAKAVIPDPISNNIEDKAKTFFQMGIEYENKGKLYEAIQFYRRAVQLVPDIELKMFEQSTTHSEVNSEEEGHEDSDGSDETEEEEAAYEAGNDLLAHLLYLSHRLGKAQLCSPLNPSNVSR